MGLIVDVTKLGFGNTNDGNTSRRFFMDPDLAAEITGLDFHLIYRFKVIIQTISSGHRIHIKNFAEYTMDTAKLYIQLSMVSNGAYYAQNSNAQFYYYRKRLTAYWAIIRRGI